MLKSKLTGSNIHVFSKYRSQSVNGQWQGLTFSSNRLCLIVFVSVLPFICYLVMNIYVYYVRLIHKNVVYTIFIHKYIHVVVEVVHKLKHQILTLNQDILQFNSSKLILRLYRDIKMLTYWGGQFKIPV